MGRTQLALARTAIDELRKRIGLAEKNKKQLIDFLQNLKNKVVRREISYYEYEQILQEKKDGKTIQEWFDYYDSYIKECEARIRQQQNKIIKNKVVLSFVSFAVILFLIFAFFYMRPVIIGLVTQEKREFTQTINLETSESAEYTWNLENLGQLNSVKISGLIQGNENYEVKVYLDDLLILDSKNLKSKSSLTGALITGFATEGEEGGGESGGGESSGSSDSGSGSESSSSDPISSSDTSSSSESSTSTSESSTSPSSSEQTQEATTSPSQEQQPPVSEIPTQQPTTTETPAEEPTTTPTETQPTPEQSPITETQQPATEQPQTTETPTEEQPSEEIPIQPETPTAESTPEQPSEQPKEEELTTIEFADICEQTCKNLELNKPSYTLKIQISNAKLKLNEIKYEITPSEIQIPEENITEINITVPEENITEIPEENITEINITVPEENITIITNITTPKENITAIENITEANITLEITENFSVSTLQYKAKIGEPVKWKKIIDLEKPGIIKIELPSSAENITINKIIETRKKSQQVETPVQSTSPSSSEQTQEATTSPSQEQPPVSETSEPSSTAEQPATETTNETLSPETKELKEVKKKLEQIQEELEQIKELLKEDAAETPKATEETPEQPAETSTTSSQETQQPAERTSSQETPSAEKQTLSETQQPITEEQTIEEAKATITGGITGMTITREIPEKSFFNSILSFIKNIFSTFTGRAITTQETPESIQVTIEDNATKYEIEYETPAPQAFEEETEKGKIITISAPEELNYTDILAYTEFPNSPENKIKLYHIKNETKEEVNITKYDLDNDGLIDYAEFIIPELLENQTYELIIEISNAEHLDSERNFISDIYNEVYQLDNIWSETIPDTHYVRVVFKIPLDNKRDITIYPRIVSGTPTIKVYEKDKSELIAEFSSLTSNEYNKIYLTNLQGEQDTFDLLIQGGSIEINHIIDPTAMQYFLIGTTTAGSGGTGDMFASTGSATAIWTPTASGNYFTWIKKYTEITTLDIQTFSLGFYCNQSGSAGGDSIKIGTIDIYDCGTSADCLAQDFTICSSNTVNIDCESGATVEHEVASCTSSGSRTLDANDYLGVRLTSSTNKAAYPSVEFNSSTYNTYFNVTETIQDNTAPTLTINYPQNTTYNRGIGDVNEINFTAHDETNLFECWYSTNGGTTNSTPNNCYSNFTSVTSLEGSNNFTVWANDTTNNEQTASVEFVKDTLTPSFSNYEDDNSSHEGTGWGNFSVDVLDTNGTVLLQINNTNYTAENYVDNKYNASVDFDINGTWQYYWISYSNFSENINTSEDILLFYTINGTPPDGTPPTLTIDYPANTTYGAINVDINEINFTAHDETNLFECWYSTNGGTTNSTPNNCYSNFTSVTSLQGSNNFTVWANDSLGNEQTASVVFVKDTYIPVFSNYWDDNSSKVGTGQTGNFSVDIIDTNGTVLLQINNTNYTAEEYTSGKYNASVLFDLNDTWSYYWISYSNFSQNLNTSEDILNFYTINNTLNTAPTITYVSPIPDTDPTAASTVSVHFNLTVYDEDGVSNINNDTVMANFTNEGEAVRVNSTCSSLTGEVTDDDKSQNFTCSIDIWYWDENADWNITAYAEDNSAESAINDSTTFLYKQLISIEIAPSSFTLTANMGAENSTSSDDPILVNNTGNANITEGNVQINAINLYGATGDFIDVGNFTSDIDTGGDACSGDACLECDGTFLLNGSDTGITNAFLARGNLSEGEAQEQLYLCILKVPSGIPSQSYSTSEAGSSDWIIKIVVAMVFVYATGTRRKGKKKKKIIENDKLIQAFELIADKLKEEYPLNKKQIMKIILEKLRAKYNISKKEIAEMLKLKEELNIPITIFSSKLGALEAITKYLKENLNLSYREIAKLLDRNERTIWSSYDKARKKQSEPIKPEETEIMLPLSIFKNRKLTILETSIVYLKEKGFKHSEIAELLKRDQRNIWTIYSRTVRKLKRKL